MERAPARIRGSFKALREALGLFEIDMTGKIIHILDYLRGNET